MVKTSGSWLPEHRFPWDLYTSENCMFAPVEYKTCGFSPATTNLRDMSNLGLNGSGFSGFPKGDLPYEANDLSRKPVFRSQVPPLTQSEYISEQTSLFRTRFDVLTSTDGAPAPQKKFLIFDQSGKETRLIDSTSLFRQNAAQTRHPPWSHQRNERELVCNEKYVIPEESGENEAVDEGSEMHEDTEEINALLYSDDDNDFDDDFDGESEEEDDDEVSTGHSPSVNQEHDFDEVASLDKSTKRQKNLDGGHNKPPFLSATIMENQNPSNETTDGGELVCSSDEGSSPVIGNKRVRNDKIHHTLRVLESIIPGLKSKDPVIILDEAINYLKSLKSNAKTMSMEDPDGSSCYGPSN